MEKIYWAIQSLDNAGGTEAVSINLMNLLCPYYEVTCISMFSFEGQGIHKLDPRIKVVTLGLPREVSRFDQFFKAYFPKHPIKLLKLLKNAAGPFFFNKGGWRKKMAKIIDPDGIYIASSLDSYLLAPKNRTTLFHYHFGRDHFFGAIDSYGRRHSRKPDGYIFLAEATKKKIEEKCKWARGRSYFVYNPVKFPRVKPSPFQGNRLLFVGRFTEQKDPLLALEIAKKLKEDNFPYHLDMYGDGHFEEKMRAFLAQHHLEEDVTIFTKTATTPEVYLAHDAFLLTSRFEGFALVKGEANVHGLPVLSTKWQGPIDEVFGDPDDGIIIDSRGPDVLAKAIEDYLKDEETVLKRKAATYEAAAKQGSEPIVAKWRTILDHFFEANKSS